MSMRTISLITFLASLAIATWAAIVGDAANTAMFIGLAVIAKLDAAA